VCSPNKRQGLVLHRHYYPIFGAMLCQVGMRLCRCFFSVWTDSTGQGGQGR
jgi:hypothetical protein